MQSDLGLVAMESSVFGRSRGKLQTLQKVLIKILDGCVHIAGRVKAKRLLIKDWGHSELSYQRGNKIIDSTTNKGN